MLKGLKDYFRYLKDTAYKNITVKTQKSYLYRIHKLINTGIDEAKLSIT